MTCHKYCELLPLRDVGVKGTLTSKGKVSHNRYKQIYITRKKRGQKGKNKTYICPFSSVQRLASQIKYIKYHK